MEEDGKGGSSRGGDGSSGESGDDEGSDESETESEETESEETDSDDDSDDSDDSDSDSPWLLLDDDAVERAAPGALAATFGATRGGSCGGVDHGYILMYERCD